MCPTIERETRLERRQERNGKNQTSKIAWVLIVLASYGISAHAELIHRCVSADGKVSYSDIACPSSAKSVEEIQVDNAIPATPGAGYQGTQQDLKLRDEEFQKRRAIRQREEEEEQNRQDAAARAASSEKPENARQPMMY